MDEFNLSVLEDAIDFSSPLKNCANYETIVDLINEEIDINAQDETESDKIDERASAVAEKSQRRDSDGAFKSPFRRKSLLRVKATRGRKPCVCNFQRNGRTPSGGETRRAGLLGAVKPGRTSPRRRKRSSASRSADTSGMSDWVDVSILGATDVAVDEDAALEGRSAESVDRTGDPSAEETATEIPGAVERGQGAETSDGAKGLDQNTTASSHNQPDAPSSEVSSPAGMTQSDDFVESSQSMLSSTLRRKLSNNRRSTLRARPNEEDARIGVAESDEEEAQNFSLNFSPSSNSQASSSDDGVAPPRLEKRRVSAISPVERSASKKRKTDCSVKTKTSPECGESTVSTPLKGLTQELENCTMSSDYEQMSETLRTDTLNRTSFKFETIELLNEYEDSNERVNNRILSKIFSSPSSTRVKEEPPVASDPLALRVHQQQLVDDALRVEKNECTSGPTRPEPRASCSKSEKAKDGKSIAIRKSSKVGRRSANESSRENTAETKENVAPANSGEKTIEKIDAKKSTPPEKRSGHESPMIEAELNNNSATSETREPTVKPLDETPTEGKGRRHSARLAIKTRMKVGSLRSDDDVDLAVEAANVSKKIEEAAKKMAITEQTLAKFKDIDIRLRHEVLPQHRIESRAGSRALSYTQQKQFLQYAPLSKETYSPAEDEIIFSNWNNFCRDNNWNPDDYEPFLKLRHGNEYLIKSLTKRRQFVQYLANGLPNRPLCSVYTRFRTLYGKPLNAKTRYTKEEDVQILAYMLHKPVKSSDNKCSELAKVLDRTRESIWARYKTLMRQYCDRNGIKVLRKVKWNLTLAGEFLSILLDVTFSRHPIELKDAFIPKVVWLKIEEKMKIYHEALKRFWELQLHMQLFATEPLFLNQIKIRLIEHMYANQIRHRSEIKWQRVVRYFDGFTMFFLRKVFNHLAIKASTKTKSRNFKKMLDWLYTKKINDLLSGPTDKSLPRIYYKDGKAYFRKEDLDRLQSCSVNSDADESHM